MALSTWTFYYIQIDSKYAIHIDGNILVLCVVVYIRRQIKVLDINSVLQGNHF